MAWSELEIVCKKHPDHRQQPGVCSICLREKLSHLSNLSPSPSQMIRTIVAVSSLSANSSYTSSTSITPPIHQRHRRHASTGGSLGFIISRTAGGLKKSRSIAFIATSEEEDEKHTKKGGFWKKLIRSTGKGTRKVFMHSRTVKEERSHVY